ncbi:MAG: ECF transporter S component [Ruminococcaceae bacterium]|nr:ECF transporter S component [Oscillospiraceae bacterium]
MSIRKNKLSALQKVQRITVIALFCAFAYVAMFVTSWIKVGFLTFDAKDTVVTIAGLLFGPLYSLIISFSVAFIELITVGDTGFWGFLMNFLSTAVFACSCALIYKYKKNIKGAIIGICVAVVSMTAVMLLLNLLVTPIYTGQPSRVIASMIPTLFLPFNLAKAIMNGALVLVLYKPISRAMKAAGVLPTSSYQKDEELKKSSLKTTFAVLGIGILFAAISLIIFVAVLGGSFSFGV